MCEWGGCWGSVEACRECGWEGCWGSVEACVDGEGVGGCRGMCGWGGYWGSVEACVNGEGVGGVQRHVWMGRVLRECRDVWMGKVLGVGRVWGCVRHVGCGSMGMCE